MIHPHCTEIDFRDMQRGRQPYNPTQGLANLPGADLKCAARP
jgi:hypothetical protein